MRKNPPSCREALHHEFLRRKGGQKAYSLRAFAQDLGLSPSYLSRLMSGERQPSPQTIRAIGLALGLNAKEARRLILHREMQDQRQGKVGQMLQAELADLDASEPGYERLRQRQFSVFSRWFYPALLELTQMEQAPRTAREFAQRLGVGIIDAEIGLDRLQGLGLMEKRDGAWFATSPNVCTGDVPSATVRAFHAQLLDRAKLAMETQDFQRRDITGTTVATSPEKIAEAKVMIRDFRRQLVAFLSDGPKSTVYHVAIQLFGLLGPEMLGNP